MKPGSGGEVIRASDIGDFPMWPLAQLEKIKACTCQELLQNADISQSVIGIPKRLRTVRQFDFPKIPLSSCGEFAKRRLSAFTSFSLARLFPKARRAMFYAIGDRARKPIRKLRGSVRQRCSRGVAIPGEKVLWCHANNLAQTWAKYRWT